jgi:hypothetical protein
VQAAPPPGSEEKARKEAPITRRIAAPDRRPIKGKAQWAGRSVTAFRRRTALGKTIGERVPPALRRRLDLPSSTLPPLTKLANAKLPGTGIEEWNDFVTRLRQTLK